MKNTIDIVITWVNGSDPVWAADYKRTLEQLTGEIVDASIEKRYNDNGVLKYLLRSIEKNCSWVNKIYFVTYGHLPEWLEVNNDKLVIVNHKDFIPTKYLPTFNSATINLNLHRIKGLSEQFIYANDDMIFLKKCNESDFFKNNLPCDCAIQDVIGSYKNDCFYHMILNDLTLLNSISKKRQNIKKNFCKWFNLKYGSAAFMKNVCLSRFNLYTGFFEPHTPAPYLKSNYEQIWEKFSNELNTSCCKKFRSNDCNTENLARWYAIGNGKFVPTARNKNGYYTFMSDRKLDSVIAKQKYKMICINYDSSPERNNSVLKMLDSIFPDKSIYEK